MFDNPKKELEWLQAQLLAAESCDDDENEVPEELDEDIDLYEDFEEDEPFDEELDALLNGSSRRFDTADRNVSRRAAGFDADDYVMDTDRYVPARKKKGKGGLLFAAFLVMLAAGLFFFWWKGWLI